MTHVVKYGIICVAIKNTVIPSHLSPSSCVEIVLPLHMCPLFAVL